MIASASSSSPPPGSIPPRPVTIHKSDRCTVAFEEYGTAEISGPRKAELVGMVSALPLVLKALVSVSTALRSGTALDLSELETALAEAGIASGPLPAEGGGAAPPVPAPSPDRLADLLAAVAVRFGALLQDRANFRAPRALKGALAETVDAIRQTLRETGHGDPLPDFTMPDAAGADTLGAAA